MEKSTTPKTNVSSRLRKVMAAIALMTAAGVFAFGGTALAKHDHEHGEHGGWHGHHESEHGDWHGDRDDWRGRGYGYDGPDYYYAPPGPDYYYEPDPYAYYPPQPDYYPPPPYGIERFFGLL
jgi:hypothetical protein